MSSERWEEVKALLGAVLERPVEDRERFLAEHPRADAELKLEVGRLLASGPELQTFLEPPSKGVMEAPLRLISLAFTGCRIGDFQIIEEIGSGSSGVVYRARQVSLGRPAAVKILAHNLCVSDEARERFRREAGAASKLRHDAIVSVYAHGEQHGAFYIAMELVEGRNLRDLIAARVAEKAEGTPVGTGVDVSDPVVAAALVEQLARGLQHCHENRVVHRDVKPQNIVIDDRLQPRLIDFGLAKDSTLDELTATGTLSGTPHYMSPEQAKALGAAVDLRTDIYSLGVVLYELITLQRPFETEVQTDLLQAIICREPRHVTLLNPAVPADLAAVCMKALAKRPEDRYPSAAALADDLRRFLGGERTRAPRRSALRRARDVARRRRGQIVAGLCVVGLVTVAGLRDPPEATAADTPAWASDTPAWASDAPGSVHAIRAAFEDSIKDQPPDERLKQRRIFNEYLKQRIRSKQSNQR